MFAKFHYKLILKIVVLSSTILSCNTKNEIVNNKGYFIENGAIKFNEKAIQLVGANTFQSFGVGSSDLKSWNLDITREFIGNVKENPVTGAPILDANGKYLHALQTIVNENRANSLVTILSPFGWDGTQANLFTGKRPTEMFWWNDFKTILAQWAIHFKDQNDVWIEVWNEPYNYNRTDGYTDEIWLNDMNELYSIVRNHNSNIILIPCAEQGQDESILINQGANFLSNKENVLFDIHAYEKWLLVPNDIILTRLENLKSQHLPIIFAELAPVNAGVLMNPTYFLETIYMQKTSMCAWLWKYDEMDQDALLTTNGLPNNNNNNNWGTVFKNIALKNRN